ncbi:ATP-dependent helicase [Candidatus Saganbacteria bacterium]|nr:ATP-dependent helicase [Candidatus Saganbacteria bacterium]
MIPLKEMLKGLNSEQAKAVTHGEGPLLIIAGAGTGKTTVITRRIAYLIAQKKAKPGEILALTFTDKAAQEMEARVDIMVPYGFVDVSLSTFHAFGDRVLRDHALDLGLRPDYRVISLSEQIIFFREHIFEFPLHYYKSLGDPTKHIEALLGVISRAKDEDVSPEEFLAWAKKKPPLNLPLAKGEMSRAKSRDRGGERGQQLEVARIYKKYQELKAEKGLVDFGDQVSLTLKLFRKYSSVLKEYLKKYKFILVDEFQDTNYAQFELLKLLAGKNANLTVVGDDDQSIYKFRGAAISNILSFEKVYKKCKKIVLTKNYRSTQIILDSARRLIKFNDPERLEIKAKVDKRLVAVSETAAERRGSKRVEHKHFDRVTSEADWVAQIINEKKYPLKEYAILVRSNADAEPFRQALNILGIPHQFSGGGGLYVFPEIKLLVSFLRVIGDPSDSVSLYDLSLSEVYQLDPLDLQKMNTFAGRRNLTLHHVFTHLEESQVRNSEFGVLNDIREESRATVKKIMEDIGHYLAFAKQKAAGEVLHQFLKKSGYLAKLTREQSVENENRIQNIAQFFEKVTEFKEIAEIDRVSEFVRHLNILKEAGDDPESAQPDFDADAVQVLTLHKAKGLEFSVVFLVSLVADKFPVRTRKHPIELPEELIKEEIPPGDFHLMEERRLFYVGMTRAKRELYLTSAVDYGGKRDRKVSQFVLEALDMPKADISVLKRPALTQIELFAAPEAIIPLERKRTKDEVLPLSHYQIDDYLTCPLKYKYVHILRVPLLPNQQIIYGAALHQAVQTYFTAKKNRQKFTEKQLLDTFANNWSSEGFISRAHEEQRFAAGKTALKRFYKTEKKRGRVPLYVEEKFAFTDEGMEVRGRWDLVEESRVTGRGSQIFIVDFKSSEVKTQKEADRRVKNSLQLSIYALSWQKKYGRLPDSLELYFLESGLVGSTTINKEQTDETWEEISKVGKGIREADYRATPSFRSCSYCPYNEICPSSAV